jgi:hypothetical protein
MIGRPPSEAGACQVTYILVTNVSGVKSVAGSGDVAITAVPPDSEVVVPISFVALT